MQLPPTMGHNRTCCWTKKSPSDSSDTLIEGQRKNPTEANLDLRRTEVKQALVSATSESEKPMDIDQDEHKKHACIPNNVSIKEPNPGSPDTGTPEQKCLKNDDLETTSVATAVNCKLFPEPKATEIQEHPSNANNEDDMDWSTFPNEAQDYNLVKASPYEWQAHQDTWLQAVMRTAMNDTTVPGIPTINHVEHDLAWPEPPAQVSPTPTHNYVVKYDVCFQVSQGNDPVNQTRNALLQFFQKIKSVDPDGSHLPLRRKRLSSTHPCLNKTWGAPWNGIQFTNLCHKDGGTCHLHIFFGFSEPPSKIFANIGWFYHSNPLRKVCA